MIYFGLSLSVLLNFFLIWFTYKMIYRLSDLVALVDDIRLKIDIFKEHLSRLYELETFYGDSSLENLLRHSKELAASFDQFSEEYDLLQQEDEDVEL